MEYYCDEDRVWLQSVKVLKKRSSDPAYLDLARILRLTIFVIPNTNYIFYNYPVFKLFGNESNYKAINDYFFSLIAGVIESHGTFEIHSNLEGFTISALSRYLKCIRSSLDELVGITRLSKIVLYYTPYFISTIIRLVNTNISTLLPRVQYISKNESAARLEAVLCAAI